MSKPYKGEKNIGISKVLKHLKTGDIFNIESNNNICQSFTVLGADIVHKDHPSVVGANNTFAPNTLTLTGNYPFGRRICDTPFRYVVYAELTH